MFHNSVLFSLLCCLLFNLCFAQSLRGQSVRVDYNCASNDVNANSLKTAITSSWETSSSPLNVPPGYWKLSTETVNPIKCPIAEACLGGSSFSPSDSQTCASGYRGPLCDTCTTERFLDISLQKCATCRDYVIWIGLGLMIPLAIFIPIFICSLLGGFGTAFNGYAFSDLKDVSSIIDSNGQSARTALIEDHEMAKNSFLGTFFGINNKNSQSEYYIQRRNEHEDRKEVFLFFWLARLKILISSLQMISALPGILRLGFPPVASSILRVYSHLSLGSLQQLPLNCLAPSVPQFQTLNSLMWLEIVTITPLVTAFALVLIFLCHEVCRHAHKHFTMQKYDAKDINEDRSKGNGNCVDDNGNKKLPDKLSGSTFNADQTLVGQQRDRVTRKRRTLYATLIYLLFFVCLANTSSAIFSTYLCQDLDPEGIFQNSYHSLRAEATLSCVSEQYFRGVYWALASTALFPFGITFFFLVKLAFHRKDIIRRYEVEEDKEVYVLISHQKSVGSRENDEGDSDNDDSEEGEEVGIEGGVEGEEEGEEEERKVGMEKHERRVRQAREREEKHRVKCEIREKQSRERHEREIRLERERQTERTWHEQREREAEKRARDVEHDKNAYPEYLYPGNDYNLPSHTQLSVGDNLNTDHVHDHRKVLSYNKNIQWNIHSTRFLFEEYFPSCWYWECVECSRRILFIGLFQMIFQGSALQIVLMTAFSALNTSVYSFFRPHRSPWLRSLADISNVQIILLLLVLLLLRVDTTNNPLNGAGNMIYSTNTDYLTVQAYDVLLSIIILATPAAFIIQSLWPTQCCRKDQGVSEYDEDYPHRAECNKAMYEHRHVLLPTDQQNLSIKRLQARNVRVASDGLPLSLPLPSPQYPFRPHRDIHAHGENSSSDGRNQNTQRIQPRDVQTRQLRYAGGGVVDDDGIADDEAFDRDRFVSNQMHLRRQENGASNEGEDEDEEDEDGGIADDDAYDRERYISNQEHLRRQENEREDEGEDEEDEDGGIADDDAYDRERYASNQEHLRRQENEGRGNNNEEDEDDDGGIADDDAYDRERYASNQEHLRRQENEGGDEEDEDDDGGIADDDAYDRERFISNQEHLEREQSAGVDDRIYGKFEGVGSLTRRPFADNVESIGIM